jgi:hypothetical protein
MSFLPVALILGVLAPVTYLSARKVFPELIRRKAASQLEKQLFPEGSEQKAEVIKCCRELTGARFSDEDILDYFMKMKGLQVVDINSRTNFWLKKYLFSPAPIKLNYFEQVKFYELFLNFPEKSSRKENRRKQESTNKNKTRKKTCRHIAEQETAGK